MSIYRQPSTYRRLAAMTAGHQSYRHPVTPLYIRGDGVTVGGANWGRGREGWYPSGEINFNKVNGGQPPVIHDVSGGNFFKLRRTAPL
jgi:hypothetical protein